MSNMNKMPQVVVVHKGKRKNSKVILDIFENTRVDDIITTAKRKPLVPDNHEILDIGVGSSFIKKYTLKYKL